MTTAPPIHRGEFTGNTGLDRIQNNVRTLVQNAKDLFTRVARLERAHGHGFTTITMTDKDLTVTDSQFANAYLWFAGTNTATRIVHLPAATDATAYFRWIANVTGQTLTLKTSTTTTYALPTGRVKGIFVNAAGPSETTL